MNNVKSDIIKDINHWFDHLDLSEQNHTRLYRWDPNHSLPTLLKKLIDVLKIPNNQIKTLKVEHTQDYQTQSPHSDTPMGQTTVVIPLMCMEEIATFTFDAWYVGHNTRGFKYRPSGLTYYDGEWLSKDTDKLIGLTDEQFDRKMFDRWLWELRYEDLHGLKIQKCFKWKVGEPISFPSNQLHSGSSFKKFKRFCVIHHSSTA